MEQSMLQSMLAHRVLHTSGRSELRCTIIAWPRGEAVKRNVQSIYFKAARSAPAVLRPLKVVLSA